MASRVFVARHGERLDHMNPSWRRTAARKHDSPLTEGGIRMGRALGHWIAKERDGGVTKVYTSPLIRCVETANAAARSLGLGPGSIHCEPGLIEEDQWLRGDSGSPPWHLPVPKLRSLVGARVNHTYEPLTQLTIDAKGRDRMKFHDRCEGTIRAIADDPRNNGSAVLVVSHATVVLGCAASLCPSIRTWAEPHYTGVTELERTSEGWEQVGEVHSLAHLGLLRDGSMAGLDFGPEGDIPSGGSAGDRWDSDDPIGPESPQKPVLRIEFNCQSFAFEQVAHLGLSHVVWPSSVALAKYMVQVQGEEPGYWRDKRILELGCGCGLAGIVAASMGAHVTATDIDEVVPLASANAERNAAQIDQGGGSVTCRPLDWRTDWGAASEPEADQYDHVIAADVVYHQDLFDPLMRTLLHHTRPRGPPNGSPASPPAASPVVHIAHLRRWKSGNKFFRKARRQFDCEEVFEDDRGGHENARHRPKVFRWKRRPK